jgi:hypothetical protein
MKFFFLAVALKSSKTWRSIIIFGCCYSRKSIHIKDIQLSFNHHVLTQKAVVARSILFSFFEIFLWDGVSIVFSPKMTFVKRY